MKCRLLCRPPGLLALLAATACTGTSGPQGPAPDPTTWPVGLFDLQATVQYGQTSGAARRMVNRTFHATLAVNEAGGMRFETDAGICQEDSEFDVERQMARGTRAFACGGALYTLQPAGNTVRGQISVSYTEAYRERGSCMAFDEDGGCLEYAYVDRERPATARASLRVQRRV